MNVWTKKSIDLANQDKYLDLLSQVYPMSPEDTRMINDNIWRKIAAAFDGRDENALIENLLRLDLFPVKDSYVAYLRRDPSVIPRNPDTIHRLAERIFAMGLDELHKSCSAPIETNRQIGPLFKRWVNSGALGVQPTGYDQFIHCAGNAILDGTDAKMKQFAREKLGYTHEKGLDFLGKFNGKYIIGEAKFLTDFGGHQNAQFADAVSTLSANCHAIKIAILDGVLYIPGKHKLYQQITQGNLNILSALVLKDFLYQV